MKRILTALCLSVVLAVGLSAQQWNCVWNAPGCDFTWTTPAFDADDFSCTGVDCAWVVEAGDVITYQYMIANKTMWLTWRFATTTLTNTPSAMTIKVPEGKIVAKTSTMIGRVNNGASPEVSVLALTAAATVISIQTMTGANWVDATNTTVNTGQVFFEIQ